MLFRLLGEDKSVVDLSIPDVDGVVINVLLICYRTFKSAVAFKVDDK